MTNRTRSPSLSAIRVSGAGTFYPTGGQLQEGSLGSTTTQANSMFAGSPTTASNRKSCNLVRAIVVNTTAAAITLVVQSHAGSTVLQQIHVGANSTAYVELGIETQAGFRIVGVANVDATVLYDASR